MKKIAKVLAVVLMATVLFTSVEIPAQAKSVKAVVETQKKGFTAKLSKGPVVSLGTTTVNVSKKKKESYGAVTFIVPADGKYTFTFSDFKKTGSKTVAGFVHLASQVVGGGYTIYTPKTEGGKCSTLFVVDKTDKSPVPAKKGIHDSLKKRTAKNVSLKKGKKIVIISYLGCKKNYSYKVNIKKVK